MTHQVVIALGSNLGDSAAILVEAIAEIAQSVTALRASSFYQTHPVGGPSQPDYLNAVIVGETELAPEELLAAMQVIENRHGRVRTERWGARTLDIDLIDYASAHWESAALTLPHPRAHERAFVLLPWSEVDPDAILIGHGAVNSLISTMDISGVVRR
ncbi:2-amino-4-hydroxy-6-hydroxymethyldihydropteridine pyrophosphokinase [mine drainage metagenome]|uniref:2-amino-4-hydroxy-6-hydroxymethyldihydropteridine diphosphokinase n=1 Tax=mine drainage metagenome TaxID=410659 RepID=A0A1J5PND9_9ZZZZ